MCSIFNVFIATLALYSQLILNLYSTRKINLLKILKSKRSLFLKEYLNWSPKSMQLFSFHSIGLYLWTLRSQEKKPGDYCLRWGILFTIFQIFFDRLYFKAAGSTENVAVTGIVGIRKGLIITEQMFRQSCMSSP